MTAQNDQLKLKKRLEALLKLPDNLYCADCKKRGPRWASANLGIFICIECSGIHRNLGVHISFVRSVNLDSWTKQQVDFMEEWGNGRANEYFEANVPSHVIRPKEGDAVRVVERYIRDKYEFRKFIAKSLPPKNEIEVVEEEREPESVVAKRPARQHGHHSQNHNTPNRQSDTPKQVEVPKPTPAAAPAPALLDFMDDPAPAPTPVAHSVSGAVSDPFASQPGAPVFDAFASAPQPLPTQGGFNAFDSAPAAPAQTNNFQNFNDPVPPAAPSGFNFGNQQQQQPQQQQHHQQQQLPSGFDFGPQQHQQQQQQQQPPRASADAILSLYNPPPNRGPPQLPLGGGFGQPMYPPNHPPPMMNVNHNQGPPRPMGYGQAPGYPYQQQQQPYPGFNNVAPPVNPFAPQGGIPHQGYPPQYQFQQPPVNPFNPNSGIPQNGAPYNPNLQYQQGWQR